MEKHKDSFSLVLGETPSPLVTSTIDSAAHLQRGDQLQVGYVLMQVEPSETANVNEKSPLNLAIVIDRSTSMKGKRLQKVKMATHLLLDKLSTNDILSVVTYSDRAEVVVPAGPIQNKQRLVAQISSIRAAGGTETLQGLTAAMRELTRHPNNEYINHLVLLTDGHTYGDGEESIALARQAAEAGISISAFGIGTEWNDFFLDELVSHSGGQTGFIEEPEQIIHLLRQRISGLGALYAQNIKLKVDLPDNVTIKEVFKVTPFTQPLEVRRNEIQLGSIEGRTPLTVLFELAFQNIEKENVFIPFALKAEVPSEMPPEAALSDDWHLRIGHEDKALSPQLMEAVRLINLTRMNDQVWQEVQAGEIDKATRRMTFLTRRLEEVGLNDLALTAKTQTMALKANGTLGDAERMMIKYGTRAQLTQNLTELFSQIGEYSNIEHTKDFGKLLNFGESES